MIAQLYSVHPYALLALLWLVSAAVGLLVTSGHGRGCSGLVLGLLLGPFGVIVAAITRRGVHYATIADLRAMTRDMGKTGISLGQSDAFTITEAAEGSSAHDAGIEFGDRLIMIDGVPCDGDYRNMVLHLAGEKGSTVRIKVRRDTEVLEFTLIRK